ncbi:MAG: putative membrane protein [Alphaproteobacteria bacterium]
MRSHVFDSTPRRPGLINEAMREADAHVHEDDHGWETPPDDATLSDETDVLFDAVITPNRSLSPRGFTILMALIGVIGFICGAAFMVAGAWPVMGFFGIDVALIYWAFKLNYRSARAIEHIKLTRKELTIRRLDHRGRGIEIAIQPFWLKVEIIGGEEAEEIRLRSHGETHTVGAFLTPPERVAFAEALTAALEILRAPPHLTGPNSNTINPASDTINPASA